MTNITLAKRIGVFFLSSFMLLSGIPVQAEEGIEEIAYQEAEIEEAGCKEAEISDADEIFEVYEDEDVITAFSETDETNEGEETTFFDESAAVDAESIDEAFAVENMEEIIWDSILLGSCDIETGLHTELPSAKSSDTIILGADDLKYSVTRHGDLSVTGLKEIPQGEYSVIIPEKVGEQYIFDIGEYAFSNQENLVSVSIPSTVSRIHGEAFYGCKKLKEVTLPYSIYDIGEYAFSHCSSLTNIKLPDYLETLGAYAFSSCSNLESIDLPETLYSIAEGAFGGCSSLTSITIPEYVSDIDDYVFCGCTNLKNVSLPDNLKIIGFGAFSYCRNLTTIKLPEGLEKLFSESFSECTSLTSITIPENVKDLFWYVFSGCSNLTSITFLGNPRISSLSFPDSDKLTVYAKAGSRVEKEVYFLDNPFVSTGCIGHTFEDWTEIVKPTRTKTGQKERSCTICGEQETQTIPVLTCAQAGHAYGPWKVVKNASSSENGEITRICSACGKKEQQALQGQNCQEAGHVYGSWTVTKSPSVLEYGEESRICIHCKAADKKTIAKLTPTCTLTAQSITINTNQKIAYQSLISGFASGDSIANVTSNKRSIAYVKAGNIIGKSAGKAVITISLASGKKVNLTVIVQKKAVKTKKLEVAEKRLTLKKGKTKKLSVVVTPNTSTDKVKYTSSNRKVAVVNAKGVITAKGRGNAVITVTSGTKKVKVKVNVK